MRCTLFYNWTFIGRKFNKKHLKPEEMALGQVFGATITSTILLIINLFIFDLNMLNVSEIYNLTTMPVLFILWYLPQL